MNNIKVSIIVPVYNSEQYLSKCLDSLLRQTLKEIEVICINDGSTDSSLDILKDYAKQDSRIKIINQKNLKQGKARNIGVENASGEFIGFLDSDDWVEPEFYEKLYKSSKIHDSDIACGNVIYNSNGILNNSNFISKYTFKSNKEVITTPEQKYNLLKAGVVWNKIYKTELIVKNNIRFPENIKFEDNYFTFVTLMFSDKISLVEDAYVFYNIRDNSIMTSLTYDKNLFDFFKVLEYGWDFLNQAEVTYELKTKYKYLFDVFAINLIYSWVKQVKGYFKESFIEKAKEEFLQIDIKNNPYINFKTLKRYKKVLSGDYKFSDKLFSIKESEIYKNYTISGIKLKIIKSNKRLVNYFLKKQIKPKTVLIVEPNNCHGEVIPGYVQYFIDMGYNVDILITTKLCLSGPLYRTSPLYTNIFAVNSSEMKKILNSAKIQEYDNVFFTSGIIYTGKDKFISCFDKYKKLKKDNIIVVEHHLDMANDELLKAGKTVMLADIDTKLSPKPLIINPHYFGKIDITAKNEKITKFIMVGGLDLKRRNCDLIINAVNDIVDKGFKNFKIIVVGKGNLSDIDEKVKPYIKIKGKLNFDKMFKEMEDADFFLPLLDPENSDHERYITDGTSGSFQLIYGFRKPCIICEKFVARHGFNNKNSFVHKNNQDLSKSMINAINMNSDDYSEMQNILAEYADSLYNKSLCNLKTILDNNEKSVTEKNKEKVLIKK